MRRVDQGGREGGARSTEGGAVHARGSWPDPCTRTESVPTAGGWRADGSGWRATSPSSSSPRSTAARFSRLPLAHSRCAGPHSCATMQPQHPPRPASPPQAQTSNGHGEQTLVSPSRSSQAHTADKHPSSAPTRRLTHPLFADKARGIRLRALRFVRPSSPSSPPPPPRPLRLTLASSPYLPAASLTRGNRLQAGSRSPWCVSLPVERGGDELAPPRPPCASSSRYRSLTLLRAPAGHRHRQHTPVPSPMALVARRLPCHWLGLPPPRHGPLRRLLGPHHRPLRPLPAHLPRHDPPRDALALPRLHPCVGLSLAPFLIGRNGSQAQTLTLSRARLLVPAQPWASSRSCRASPQPGTSTASTRSTRRSSCTGSRSVRRRPLPLGATVSCSCRR